MNTKKRLERLEKELGSDSFSVIPQAERVVVVSGFTKEERETKMKVRLAEMHEKFGNFDENCLTQIFIRKFCLNRGIVEG
jgi:lipid II:glycine glycyltransferase (peptidoglycan interpeptide bridge formation enzyme)